MENMSPALVLLLEVRTALESGFSVRTGIIQFLESKNTSFHQTVTLWFAKLEHQQDIQEILTNLPLGRRSLFTILEKGLKGIPIHTSLIELEKEIVQACELEMDLNLQQLPLKLMIPVLFLMFPAYIILLFGPFIQSIINNI